MRIGRLLSATALITTAAVMLASPALAFSLANLNPAHVGSTAAGFASKDCNSPYPVLANSDGWHFVLPSAGGAMSFVSVTLTFSAPVGVVGPITSTNAGAPSTGPGWSGYLDNAGVDEKHAYVSTSPTGATLLGGTAQITPDGVIGAIFNLSHTCPGMTTPSPSPSISISPMGSVSPSAGTSTTPATAAPSGAAETGGGGSYGFSAFGVGALTLASGAGAFLYFRRRRDNVA